MKIDLDKCSFCKNYGERYFYGSTARYCCEYEKFCHDIETCDKFEEIEDEEN